MSNDAIIRTTDRMVFRTCRRKWDLSSHMRQHLGSKVAAAPLWLGSGIHYALEDLYNCDLRQYESGAEAFMAYIEACTKFNKNNVPEDLVALRDLGIGMMNYYDIWLLERDYMPTFIYEGKPQTECNIRIEIPKELIPNHDQIPYDKVFYSLTLDRLSWDPVLEGIWIVEYKTAARFETQHLPNDAQVSAYIWACEQLFPDIQVLGVCYQQHKKTLPKPGRKLKSGEVSAAAQQSTTRTLYKKTLIETYGSLNKAPEACINTLNGFAAKEDEHYDDFIRRDFIYRNKYTSKAESEKILMETAEMLNPNTFIYPNPTRQCSYMCSFMSVCQSMDDGSDYEHELEQNFEVRNHGYDGWRKYLPLSGEFEVPNVNQF